MGSLKGMLQFLGQASDTLDGISEKLGKTQEYFNNNFSNVNIIRNSEIEFLQKEYFSESDSFHEKIRSLYKDQLGRQELAYKQNIEDLRKQMKKREDEMKIADDKRVELLKKIRDSNKSLDKKEEKLKVSISDCEKMILEYNKKIDELNTGFGFVLNLFKMKKHESKKEELIEARNTFVESIEEIRSKWEEQSKIFEEDEKKVSKLWDWAKVELSLIDEKLVYLKNNREEIIKKAAFTGTLGYLKGDEDYLVSKISHEKHAKCKRCNSDNSENLFFCFYCGERFAKDRGDISGSLVEIGELNEVYEKLLDGVKKSVSFLALIKGINTGLKEFIKSVKSVEDSQDKYASLPNLDINIPDFTLKFYDILKELRSKIDVDYFNLHPKEFAGSLEEYETKVFTDKNIELFFSKMGDELNKTTKEQWG